MGDARDTIRGLLRARGAVATREVAQALGISRQAAHRHLRALVDAGELAPQGAGRGAHYVAGVAAPLELTFATSGLREEQVWADLLDRSPLLSGVGPVAHDVLQYASTELLNNAIDHAGSDDVTIRVEETGDRVVLEVEDRGEGIFEHIRSGLGLSSQLEALQELSKGKTTTMPSRHTGEGIFFTSKAGDFFGIESGTLRWLVDNERNDVAVERLDTERQGTLVRFELDPRDVRPLSALFDEYTDDYEFNRSRTVVKLFTIGVRFVSRSEAKRLVSGLEKFREVVLDFAGVRLVGQGFADEVFRVWAREHPEVRLVPVNMAEGVELMVRRALAHASS